MGALEIVKGVTITHPEPWTAPYTATITTEDGTMLRVQVLETAAAAVREVALLTYICGRVATAELQGDTLTRAWID